MSKASMIADELPPPPPLSDEQLPSYGESSSQPLVNMDNSTQVLPAIISVGGDNDLLVPPGTLRIGGRFVYSSDPNAPALYELSHSIGFLKDSDRNVTLERLDHTIKYDRDGSSNSRPQMNTRKRHIFDLKHPISLTAPTFDYHAQSMSRQSLCSFGMKLARSKSLMSSSSRVYRVHRAVMGADRYLVEREVLFTAASGGRGQAAAVLCEWRKDEEGDILAREVLEEGMISLMVTAEMERSMRDALVAAWVLRIWWELVKGTAKGMSVGDVRKMLTVGRKDFNVDTYLHGFFSS